MRPVWMSCCSLPLPPLGRNFKTETFGWLTSYTLELELSRKFSAGASELYRLFVRSKANLTEPAGMARLPNRPAVYAGANMHPNSLGLFYYCLDIP